ncbi:hypothetical protein [Streptomyces sp. NPDC014734]|uniref:hypothetical protein n=1 Tax=Streptomyces sp. NPDC014734 TaxID=3364886 RepID=UPI0036FD2933
MPGRPFTSLVIWLRTIWSWVFASRAEFRTYEAMAPIAGSVRTGAASPRPIAGVVRKGICRFSSPSRLPEPPVSARTEARLGDLDPRWVVPVRRCLERLDAAAAAWDPATMKEPEWQSKVTPEGETRKRVCRFEDVDGKWETFHLHARFTPGAGRIHFRPIGEEGTIRIAHVGGKIRPDL